MTNANPWVTHGDQESTSEPSATIFPTRRQAQRGPSTPQAGVSTPDTADRLPQRPHTSTASLWWLGVHGGAGESTLATLAADTRPAHHGWPVVDTSGVASRVALVARTNWAGLTAAQRAATEWASGALGDSIQLVGLVLIPDAPGRLPKPLRDLQQVIAGGVPQVWTLPWVDAWRLGPADPSAPFSKEFRALLADLQLTQSSTAQI